MNKVGRKIDESFVKYLDKMGVNLNESINHKSLTEAPIGDFGGSRGSKKKQYEVSRDLVQQIKKYMDNSVSKRTIYDVIYQNLVHDIKSNKRYWDDNGVDIKPIIDRYKTIIQLYIDYVGEEDRFAKNLKNILAELDNSDLGPRVSANESYLKEANKYDSEMEKSTRRTMKDYGYDGSDIDNAVKDNKRRRRTGRGARAEIDHISYRDGKHPSRKDIRRYNLSNVDANNNYKLNTGSSLRNESMRARRNRVK